MGSVELLCQTQPGESSVNPTVGSPESWPEMRTGPGRVPVVNLCSVSYRATELPKRGAGVQLRPDKVQTLLPKAHLAPIEDQQEWNSVPAQEQISSPDAESVCQTPLGLFMD